ncbi:unnamed protein product, partial [Scytosiphon promiscuus]
PSVSSTAPPHAPPARNPGRTPAAARDEDLPGVPDRQNQRCHGHRPHHPENRGDGHHQRSSSSVDAALASLSATGSSRNSGGSTAASPLNAPASPPPPPPTPAEDHAGLPTAKASSGAQSQPGTRGFDRDLRQHPFGGRSEGDDLLLSPKPQQLAHQRPMHASTSSSPDANKSGNDGNGGDLLLP